MTLAYLLHIKKTDFPNNWQKLQTLIFYIEVLKSSNKNFTKKESMWNWIWNSANDTVKIRLFISTIIIIIETSKIYTSVYLYEHTGADVPLVE